MQKVLDGLALFNQVLSVMEAFHRLEQGFNSLAADSIQKATI